MAADRPEREDYILDLLAKDGTLSVAALSHDLGVSQVTVRNHLRSLEDRGLLSRTWGGATVSSIKTVLERAVINSSQKDAIARRAAALVRDGDRVMIEAGTTTALIPKHLAERTGVHIVTNSTLVFGAARNAPGLEVTLTGGLFHRASESLVGPLAVRSIRGFNARLAFVGTDGFTLDRGMTTPFAEGAEVIEAMHERSEETWLVADSSKYGRAGFVSVLRLSDLSGIIMDGGLPDDARQAIEEATPVVGTD
ncbi:MAG: DeoR/GlpR family DNA-binding transcription regulator [Propionibacteriaceae bacterium]|jgi:DeoR family galactitol utilization operon repressor|nr:DeoR/GlpR family DNA-binding transcription regulator [Propionibacteriaceae bacterium]